MEGFCIKKIIGGNRNQTHEETVETTKPRGSGWVAVGRAVVSNISDPQFESNLWQPFQIYTSQ